MTRNLRQPRAPKKNRGQELVEFALVLPVLILIIMGTMEYGRAYYTSSLLQNAAREGARYGILHPTVVTSSDGADPNNITARAKGFITGLNSSKLTIDVSYPDGDTSRGSRVRVTVSYLYESIVPFLHAYTMRGNSTMHIE